MLQTNSFCSRKREHALMHILSTIFAFRRALSREGVPYVPLQEVPALHETRDGHAHNHRVCEIVMRLCAARA